MTLPFNPAPVEPHLKDVLDIQQKSIMLSLNCHHVGTVQLFDPIRQTAVVKINYPKTYYKQDPLLKTYSAVLVDYPLLLDCPVVILGGGLSSLSFPILPGDECLVLFNDRDLDNWFAGGTGTPPATQRLHSFADGIALVGIRSLPKVLLDYDSIRALLKNGIAKVGVSPTQVLIGNDLFTLGGLLQELIGEVQSLVAQTALITVICAAPGNPSSIPVNAALITSISAQLTATAAKIAGMLE